MQGHQETGGGQMCHFMQSLCSLVNTVASQERASLLPHTEFAPAHPLLIMGPTAPS